MAVVLPETLSKKLERFKKAKGKSWTEELERFLDESLDPVEAELDRLLSRPTSDLSDREVSRIAVSAQNRYRKSQRKKK